MFCSYTAASAQAAGSVVLVRTPGDDALVARIHSELSASGFDVLEVSAAAPNARGELAQLAAEHGAYAALRVAPPRRRASPAIELWSASADAATAGALDMIAVSEGELQSAEVLALRVVETLRARSLGFVAGRPPPPAAVPKPEAEVEPEAEVGPEADAEAEVDLDASDQEAPATERPRSLWLELAPSLVLGPGGLPPEVGALLALRLDASSLLSISLFGVAPVWRAELTAEEGRANVATWLLGAALDAQLRWHALSISAGAGIAAALTNMSGSAAPPFEGDDELVTSAAPMLRVALHVELATWLRIGARGMLGFSVPEVSTRFEERVVARWGRPCVLLGVGAELALAQP